MTTLDTTCQVGYRDDNMATTLTTRQADRTERGLAPTQRDLEKTGRKLARLRVGRGLSPERLGHRIDVSGRTIRRIERGEVIPLVSTMFALAEWAGEEVADLWHL